MFSVKEYTTYDGKWVYLETGAGSFNGVYTARATNRTYCWWWLSSRNDQTAEVSAGTKKVKYVARIGGEYAKIFAEGAVEGLNSGLGGASPVVGVLAETGNAVVGARSLARGGGTVDSVNKKWQGDLALLAQGTEHGQMVAYETTFVCGGCAEIRDFVDYSKLVELRVYNKTAYESFLRDSERKCGSNFQAAVEYARVLLEKPTCAVAVTRDDKVHPAFSR
ncbi:MAG: hypothetical protein ACREN3_06660 [Gemmatimonadaceae bacterium]